MNQLKNNQLTLLSCNPDELSEISRQMIEFARDYNIWAFFAGMGMGKTTLIKNICRQLNVKDIVQSPSYSLINEYKTENDSKIYHFDFYRIKDDEEVLDLGIEEYFNTDSLCLIEWPEKIFYYLPDKLLKIKINLGEKNCRQIQLTKVGD